MFLPNGMFIETYILNERCLEMILSDGQDSALIERHRLFGAIRVEKTSSIVQSWKLFSSDEFSPSLCGHCTHLIAELRDGCYHPRSKKVSGIHSCAQNSSIPRTFFANRRFVINKLETCWRQENPLL